MSCICYSYHQTVSLAVLLSDCGFVSCAVIVFPPSSISGCALAYFLEWDVSLTAEGKHTAEPFFLSIIIINRDHFYGLSWRLCSWMLEAFMFPHGREKGAGCVCLCMCA